MSLLILGRTLTKLSSKQEQKNSFVLDPFWSDLHALEKQGLPPDELIKAHLSKMINLPDINKSMYEVGITKKGGSRVLSNSDSYIRFRLKCPSSARENNDVKKSNGNSNLHRSSENYNIPFSNSLFLLPTSIGAYRLRKRTRKNCLDSVMIEFWREVPGKPVQRPPEGWDDLGVGGAEVQGRWAWGNEPKSEIEQGVAQRKAFFPNTISRNGKTENAWTRFDFWTKSFMLSSKLIVLLLLSWLAVLVTACGALSIPLAIGRIFYYLLRVPEIYIHDPIAFALGGVFMFPICCGTVESLSFLKWEEGNRKDTVLNQIWGCIYSFGTVLSHTPKSWVLLQTVILWSFFSPLLLSWIYELTIIKPASFWIENGNFVDIRSFFMSWLTGSIFLNIWAALCYFGAFRKDFLIENNPFFGFGQGAEAGNDANNNQNNENADDIDLNQDVIPDEPGVDQNNASSSTFDDPQSNGKRKKWQGKNGVIYNFTKAIIKLFLHKEWDKIDRTTLLNNCAYPVARQLAISFFTPLFAFMTLMSLRSYMSGYINADVTVPFIGLLEQGHFNKLLFQILSIMTIVIQLSIASRKSLKCWFDAAHKEAREDRYLVGEILLDYIPLKRNSSTLRN
uniref:RING-type E3 ubiquitin transferase n=1 Tax=Eucampia antarctica TaxID=49252 RepID=A0A7S2RY12_9STRA|mmetsp:Transcript_28230/g.27072  ORF Transcript_28230/g.27072 Transcript_28230/m.27072 type:complete len:619 (+) Transcript_28230:416-2272(+)